MTHDPREESIKDVNEKKKKEENMFGKMACGFDHIHLHR